MTFGNHDQETVRQYLLGKSTDDQQAKIEERLLTDDDFFDEFEMAKDELVEDYIGERLTQEERSWFEQNFLASPEGKQRQAFARALNHYVLNHPQPQKKPGLSERLSAFWNSQSVLLRAASALATIIVVAGIFWISFRPVPTTFASLILTNTAATRSSGFDVPRITLKEDALRVRLMLPSPAAQGARYRADLSADNGETKVTEVEGQDHESVSVVIPARQLTLGHSVLTLSIISPDGRPQRIPGNYQFIVESIGH
jgi:hypothetical protein